MLYPFKTPPSFHTCNLSCLGGVNLYLSQHVCCKLSHYCDAEISSSAQSKAVLIFVFYYQRRGVSKHTVKKKHLSSNNHSEQKVVVKKIGFFSFTLVLYLINYSYAI